MLRVGPIGNMGTMAHHRTAPAPITPEHIAAARRAFEENAPGDIFYRAATELVRLALAAATTLSLAEAVAVLLQSWNQSYYRYNRFTREHLEAIEDLVRDHGRTLAALRERQIADLAPEHGMTAKAVFIAFEAVLGPVGAAKSLHLLAPQLFPLWDRAIAEAYGLSLDRTGTNGDRYWSFMLISRDQCRSLGGHLPPGTNPLKAIDEYNYCHFSRKWI